MDKIILGSFQGELSGGVGGIGWACRMDEIHAQGFGRETLWKESISKTKRWITIQY